MPWFTAVVAKVRTVVFEPKPTELVADSNLEMGSLSALFVSGMDGVYRNCSLPNEIPLTQCWLAHVRHPWTQLKY